ncbi:MAG: Holliday junction branch migration protein RuvA [Deltaproteobacteria bacterium]
MYAYIKGKIAFKTPTFVYLDNNGIGYHINISLYTYSKIERLDEVKLFTYLLVREDIMSLYGFYDENEKQLFEKLISVSGIGATTAQIILSSMSPGEIINAIANENEMVFKNVKGIGIKTAKRIILDLRDKVGKISAFEGSVQIPVTGSDFKNEALAALLALGINRTKAESVIISTLKSDQSINSVETLVKTALKQLV